MEKIISIDRYECEIEMNTLHENVREEHYAMLNVEEECKNVTLREWRME